ncbi:hypothetical protein [uncultured Nostoc sp.]|uniref:hypothetical protein n=1 Tax=uncultured Nostoc sp. TaxID=340711 RepID=UPI0035CAD885
MSYKQIKDLPPSEFKRLYGVHKRQEKTSHQKTLWLTLQFDCWTSHTNSINDCNISLGKDAMNRVSTNGLFVAFFFQIGINYEHALFS